MHQKLAGQVKLSHSRPVAAPAHQVLSPNRAYWFALTVLPCAASGTTASNVVVAVFTERDYLLSVTLEFFDCRHTPWE